MITPDKTPFFTGRTVLLLAALLLALPSARAAMVTATPDTVTFDNAAVSAAVALAADGVPIPAAEIRGFRLLVGGSDYSHMLRFSKADGAVTISPSPTVEVGSYDLVISTGRGEARVRVYTPLGEHPSSLEVLAQKLGMTVEELKNRSGKSGSMARQQLQLDLPPLYHTGQTLALDMGASPEVLAVWEVNREKVSEGAGAGRLEYLFREPGAYLFTYTESRDGVVVASVSGLVEVVDEPVIKTETAAKTQYGLNAPEGYRKNTWTLDGQAVSATPKFEQTFEAPGEHIIILLQEEPASGNPGGFRKIRWQLTVTPKQEK